MTKSERRMTIGNLGRNASEFSGQKDSRGFVPESLDGLAQWVK